MALEIAFYKVTEDIAIRSGLIAERYRTADNEHWILDNKDLSRVRFTADEYINGLSGVEKITENEAETLIALGGYKFGYEGLDDGRNVVVESEETISQEDTANVEEVLGGGDDKSENEANVEQEKEE